MKTVPPGSFMSKLNFFAAQTTLLPYDAISKKVMVLVNL